MTDQSNEIPKGGRRGEYSRRSDDRVPPPPTFLRMADAPPVGKWTRESWIRIVSHDPALIVRAASAYGGRYTPEELARVVFGRWPS